MGQAIAEETRLEKVQDDLAVEVAKLESKKLIEQANKNLSESGRGAREEAYVKEWQSTFAKAAEGVVRSRLLKAEEAKNKAIKDITETALSTGARKRWHTLTGEYDKNTIKTDYRKLLVGDFDDVVTDLLVTQGQMRSKAEAEHALSSNKDFAKRARTETAEQLLTRHIQTGGKLSPQEARILIDSELGRDVIGTAISRREEYKTELAKLQKDGVVPTGWDWSTLLKNINMPKITGRQALGFAVGAGAVFMGAPHLMALLGPSIMAASDRWSDVINTGKLPDTSLSQVGESVRDILPQK
jgi:hypothetical protein